MKVRLLKRWAAYPPHKIVSLSRERALYLVKQGIGKLVDARPEDLEKELKEEARAKVAKAKAAKAKARAKEKDD